MRKAKRILSLLLVLAMMCSMLVVTAGAADGNLTMNLRLEKTNGQYQAVVYLKAPTKCTGIQLQLSYDPAIITLGNAVPLDGFKRVTRTDKTYSASGYTVVDCSIQPEYPDEDALPDISNGLDCFYLPITFVNGKSAADVKRSTIKIDAGHSSEIFAANSSASALLFVGGQNQAQFFYVSKSQEIANNISYAATVAEKDKAEFTAWDSQEVATVDLKVDGNASKTVTVNGSLGADETVNLTLSAVDTEGEAIAPNSECLKWTFDKGTTDAALNSTTVTIPKESPEGTITVTVEDASDSSKRAQVTITVTRAAPALASVKIDPATVEVSGRNDTAIKKTAQATALDQFGDAITGGITWSKGVVRTLSVDSLDTTVPDIDATTGVITFGNAAPAGTYEFSGTYSGVTESAALTLTHQGASASKDGTIVVEGSPIAQGSSTTVTVTLTDQFDNPAEYVWDTLPAGISINGNTLSVAENAKTGTYTITARAKVGSAKAVGTFEVTDRRTLVFTAFPTVTASTAVYDGASHEFVSIADVAVKDEKTDTRVEFTDDQIKVQYFKDGNPVDKADVKDVASYTAKVTVDTGTHLGTWNTSADAFAITPKDVSVSITSVGPKTYDGTTNVDVTGALVGKVEGDDVDVKLTGVAASKNAGPQDVAVTAALTGAAQKNYTLLPLSGSYTVDISKAEIAIKSVKVADKTYDGVTAAVVTSVVLADGTEAAFTADANFLDTNAGDGKDVAGTVSLTGTFGENYTLENDGAFTAKANIIPADYIVTLNRESIAIREGYELEEIAAAIVNAVGDDEIEGELTFTDKSGKEMTPAEIAKLDVAEEPYELTWTYSQSDNENYVTTEKSGTFLLTVTDLAPQNIEITDVTPVMTYGDPASILGTNVTTFDEEGAEQDVEDGGELAWTSSNDEVIVINNDGEVEIAGAGIAILTVTAEAVDGKYAEGKQTVTITVLPKPITVQVSTESMNYGDPVPTFTATSDELVEGDDLDFGAAAPSNPDAGEYPVGGVVGNKNYAAVIVPGTLTVNPIPGTDIANTLLIPDKTKVTGNQTKEIDLSAYISGIKGAVFGNPAVATTGSSKMAIDASIANNKMTVTFTPQAAGTVSTITVPVTSRNYTSFNIVITLEAVGKTDISDEIVFESKTFVYDGDDHELAATWKGSSNGFTYSPAQKESAVGTHTITATYNEGDYFGTATAVLTIINKAVVESGKLDAIDDPNKDAYKAPTAVRKDVDDANEYTVSFELSNSAALKSYYRPGAGTHEWVPVPIRVTVGGDDLTEGQIYVSIDGGETYERADVSDFVTDETGTYYVYWMPVDVSKNVELMLATSADGKDAVKVNVVCGQPAPPPSGGSSSSGGASHGVWTGGKDSTRLNVKDISSTAHGKVSISPTKADEGDRVTIKVNPDDGYEVDEVEVLDKKGREVSVTERDENEYTFIMPDSDVTVDVTFKAVEEEPEAAPVQQAARFGDVSGSDWFSAAVDYVSQNNLMSGNGGMFSPNTNMTRGMMAQILYNMEGASGSGSRTFPDVAANEWYAGAVSWAATQGYMDGYGSGSFGPNDPVTREQVAAILYRYTQTKAPAKAGGAASLAAFTDGAGTSGWAQNAVSWAVSAGIISGKSGNRLDPTGTASRAEIAQILMGFHRNILQ